MGTKNDRLFHVMLDSKIMNVQLMEMHGFSINIVEIEV